MYKSALFYPALWPGALPICYRGCEAVQTGYLYGLQWRFCGMYRESGVIKAVARMLGLLPLVFASVAGHADMVKDLYEAEVPVASQGAQALERASRVALSEVLVKVSGSVGVLQNPAIAEVIPEARKHVQQYAYSKGDGPDSELTARFEFDSSWVTRVVTQAGAPLWTANRPLVLVWLVVEDGGERYFANWESAPELSAQLMSEFSRRGVPVQLPLFDLADSAAISIQEAWRLYAPALQGASGRYDVQDILAGRLVVLSTGNSTGDWSYFSGRDRIDRSISSENAQAFVRAGASIVAEDMAVRYAVAASGAGAAGGISMMVTGVSTYADYAGVISWLEGLELIDHANIERVNGETIELRLHAQAGAGQLPAIIELNGRLQPLPPTSSGAQLNYQWQK